MRKVFTILALMCLHASSIHAAENTDGIDAMIAHLQFLGYKCTKGGKKVEARHENKLSFDITPFRGGFIFRGWFTRSAQASVQKTKYAELLNTVNSESSLVRFYFDKEYDLIIEAWYPGKYTKDTFTAFITAWEQDFISTVQKHFEEMKVFISN